MKKINEKKENLLNNDFECFFCGLIIVLISIIGLLNNGPVGNFLTYIFVFLFGAFYFIFFLLSIFFGLYLMIKRKIFKVHFSLKVCGILFIFFSLVSACSITNTPLYFNNLNSQFTLHLSLVSPYFPVINNFQDLNELGGGFVGYLLKALFNTALTPIGNYILTGLIFVIGLFLAFKEIVLYIFKCIKDYIKKTKEKKEQKKKERKIVDTEVTLNKESIYVTRENQDDSFTKQMNEDYNEFNNSSKNEDKEVNVEVNVDIQNHITPSSSLGIEDIETPVVNKEVKINQDKSYKIEDLNLEKTKDHGVEDLPLPSIDDISNMLDEVNDDFEVSQPTYVEEKVAVEPIKKNVIVEEKIIKEQPNVINNSYSNPTPTINVNLNKSTSSNSFSNPSPKLSYENVEVKNETQEEKEKVNENVTIKPKVKKAYVLPPFEILKYHPAEDTKTLNENAAAEKAQKINKTFQEYKIGAQVISYTIGPSVTRFNVKMNEGVRVNDLTKVVDEVSIALNGDKSVRLETVVEGRNTSSIEVGNVKATPVDFKECYEAIKDKDGLKNKLLIPLGKDIEGKVVTTLIDELPHVLVAGTTGSGKSVFINTIIATLLMRNTPDELKLMLIDPKKVEFSRYNELPHLLCPVISDAREGKVALKKMVDEMERRYELLARVGASKISEYNEIAEIEHYDKMSNIVLIIDEFSDFMSEYGKDIELSVKRLCQKSRACGIYLIICTQRPSVNVITGDIKGVIPSRIGLLVPSYVDSKTILDEAGAESLLGYGDMLCRLPRHNSLVRLQGSFVSSSEVYELCKFIKAQREPEYDRNFMNLAESSSLNALGGDAASRKRERDELSDEARDLILDKQQASTSFLQRELSVGFTRADKILADLEDEGILVRLDNGRREIAPEYKKKN